jgi:3-methyladenine DNA glycosylase/8-oxoguanine DNA glycosylase
MRILRPSGYGQPVETRWTCWSAALPARLALLRERGRALPRVLRVEDLVEQRLLALPGVGPYAAAHVMMLIGRYSRLILDSWTRPTYARLAGRKASDATIARRFRRYGEYAGLAFWLYLTRGWVADDRPF